MNKSIEEVAANNGMFQFLIGKCELAGNNVLWISFDGFQFLKGKCEQIGTKSKMNLANNSFNSLKVNVNLIFSILMTKTTSMSFNSL